MLIDRRGFAKGAAAFAAAGAFSGKAAAQGLVAGSPQARALAAIRDYAEAHRRYLNLPGMTVGVTSPSGFATSLSVGFANAETRAPIAPDTLFQIGSISKSFLSALLHQFAQEGRFKLSDRIVRLLPETPLPRTSPIEVQHLLDHVAGLPGDPPLFVRGGLWTAYAPGKHWHYSNTGYDLLGQLAEHFGKKPLDRLLAERIFEPLGMRLTRGAITSGERLLYAQGYEAADETVPFVRGAPFAQAPWVDVTTGAGCIGSTASDMNHYLRTLANAAKGLGGMGLGAKEALAYVTHKVPSDSPEMAYGNGLMHVEDKGRRYLHHTGGMVSFASSFHVDVDNGVGAFASSNVSAFLDYRPRKLTFFAVQALAAAEAGQKLPDPPALEPKLPEAADYVGIYRTSTGRSFEVRGGPRLTIISNGNEAPLEPAGENSFRILHPDFRAFTLMFERGNGKAIVAHWGPQSFVREGVMAKLPGSDPALARLAGRYVNDSPWWGTTILVERGGKLWIGTDTPMTPIGKNRWRVGEDSWTPERASFADFIDGQPQTFVFSGVEFARQDT
jgi:CubicO group peptidase (beta-lactamase class C family)